MDSIVSGSDNITIFRSSLHGYGVCARGNLSAGDIVFTEVPTNFLQAIPNKQDAVVCAKCARFIGTAGTQLALLTRDIGRQGYLDDTPCFDGDIVLGSIVPCFHQCGEMYCSESCRALHYDKGHRLLCTGQILDAEAEEHPLILFKQHAVQTNEIFLLVADIFAEFCTRLESVDMDNRIDVLHELLSRYADFVRHLWWDVALVSNGNGSMEEQAHLKISIHSLAHESWHLLNRALSLEERGLSDVLSVEYLARTIGMFEQNNVGVRLPNPLVAYVHQLAPSGAATSVILENTLRIVGTLEEEGGEEEEFEDEPGTCDDENEAGKEVLDADMPIDEEEITYDEGMDEPDSSEGGEDDRSRLLNLMEDVGEYSVYPPLDGTAFYTTICKINHSCVPNVMVQYTCTAQHGLCAQMVVLRDIADGEELVQSYIDQSLGTTERQALLRDYGFQCTCELCMPDTDNIENIGSGLGALYCRPCV